MQIVIDIDDEDYKDINNIHFIREDLKFKIGKAIKKGTPLPKGNEREAYNMGYKDGVEAYKAMMEIEKEEA